MILRLLTALVEAGSSTGYLADVKRTRWKS